ncbi:hypothetical protein GOBAR_DD31418 [Gossypium barbadense]|nr:hypothetical protein GOBAR_DD31418 [Gossypium barbadense]
MKLRLRNFESKETLRIQLLSSSSILQLQEAVFPCLPLNPLHVTPSSLRFSLNAKDLLHAPSPLVSLLSLGVASGDLIYFSLNPNAFSPPPQTLFQEPILMPESSANRENPVREPMLIEPQVSQQANKGRLLEHYLLRKFLGEELGDIRSIHNLMAMEIHVILLDSGFVLFDTVSGLKIDRFRLPDESSSPVSICYSLPQLLIANHDFGPNVYGSLVKGGSVYRLSLDGYTFEPTMGLLWARCFKNYTRTDNNQDGSYISYREKEILKFWKVVKDGLALPLLIDLSFKIGLPLPACFMRLPADLKLQILDSLPGTDVARMACVSVEMRYVASNNDLWRKKVEEEFGHWLGVTRNWKKIYHSCWESKKKRKRAITRWRGFPRVNRPSYFPVRRDPIPLGGVHVVHDDDYDLPARLRIPPLHQLRRLRRQDFGFDVLDITLDVTTREDMYNILMSFTVNHSPPFLTIFPNKKPPPFHFSCNPKTLPFKSHSFQPLLASRRIPNYPQGIDNLVDGPRNWSRSITSEFDDDEEDDDEEEEDRSLDLLVRFVQNVFRKISKRARKALRAILPISISTKLVGFSVDGVLILAFLWVLKAFLEVVCTLGSAVFVTILLIRGIWTGVTFMQESRDHRRINEPFNDPRSWNGAQPAT